MSVVIVSEIHNANADADAAAAVIRRSIVSSPSCTKEARPEEASRYASPDHSVYLKRHTSQFRLILPGDAQPTRKNGPAGGYRKHLRGIRLAWRVDREFGVVSDVIVRLANRRWGDLPKPTR